MEASMDVAVNKAANAEGRFIRISGGVKSGKTEALLRKVGLLLKTGVEPDAICVITNTANAAEAFEGRLKGLLEGSAHDFDPSRLTVTTVPLLVLKLLDSEGARSVLQRVPRVLTRYEVAFVMQDLVVAGFSAALVKETLACLERLWSTGVTQGACNGFEDDNLDEGSGELAAYLNDYLIALRAMLMAELPYLCIRLFAMDPERASSQGFDYVLVDDYQNLSKASQTVCEALAKTSLVVTGNAGVWIANREAYPYPEGFAEFTHVHGGGAVDLDEVDTGFEPSLLAQQIQNIKWVDPQSEVDGVCQWIEKQTYGDEGASLSDFCIVVPNRQWARAFEKSLAKRKKRYVTVLGGQLLAGDPHKPEAYPALASFTRLNLLADPADTIAWRCWCGLGLPDLGAGIWMALLGLADAKGLSIVEALSQIPELYDEPQAGTAELQELHARYLEGCALIERFGKKCGFAMLKGVAGGDLDEVFSLLIEDSEGLEDAYATFKLAWKCALDSRISSKLDAARIISYEELTGLSPKNVILVGLVDGLMPPSGYFDDALSEPEKALVIKKYEALFADTLGKASEVVMVSTIQKADRELAESQKMRITRFKDEHGKTMAMLSPSLFIAATGSLIPGSESGQVLTNNLR